VPNNRPKPASNTRAARIEPAIILLAENNTAYPRDTTDEQAINALYRNQTSHIEASRGKAIAEIAPQAKIAFGLVRWIAKPRRKLRLLPSARADKDLPYHADRSDSIASHNNYTAPTYARRPFPIAVDEIAKVAGPGLAPANIQPTRTTQRSMLTFGPHP